jgi:hypothetical protein
MSYDGDSPVVYCSTLLDCSLDELARSSIGWRIPLFQGGEEGSTPSRAIWQTGRGKAWLLRKLGELEIAGSNPAALIL